MGTYSLGKHCHGQAETAQPVYTCTITHEPLLLAVKDLQGLAASAVACLNARDHYGVRQDVQYSYA